jgi:hypothetical protein
MIPPLESRGSTNVERDWAAPFLATAHDRDWQYKPDLAHVRPRPRLRPRCRPVRAADRTTDDRQRKTDGLHLSSVFCFPSSVPDIPCAPHIRRRTTDNGRRMAFICRPSSVFRRPSLTSRARRTSDDGTTDNGRRMAFICRPSSVFRRPSLTSRARRTSDDGRQTTEDGWPSSVVRLLSSVVRPCHPVRAAAHSR